MKYSCLHFIATTRLPGSVSSCWYFSCHVIIGHQNRNTKTYYCIEQLLLAVLLLLLVVEERQVLANTSSINSNKAMGLLLLLVLLVEGPASAILVAVVP